MVYTGLLTECLQVPRSQNMLLHKLYYFLCVPSLLSFLLSCSLSLFFSCSLSICGVYVAVIEGPAGSNSQKSAHCNTLPYTATHCNTLKHAETHCNTLQHTETATHVGAHWHSTDSRQATTILKDQHAATHHKTLQPTATHWNILQPHATHIGARWRSADRPPHYGIGVYSWGEFRKACGCRSRGK